MKPDSHGSSGRGRAEDAQHLTELGLQEESQRFPS